MALPLSVFPKVRNPSARILRSNFDTASPFREDYADRLIDLFGLSSIVSYLPLDERVGSVAYDYTQKGRNGAYIAVTLGAAGIGDGRSAASFNGSTSYVNWYSAALAVTFNGAEGTLMGWAKVANAGVWTDEAQRFIALLRADNNNYVSFDKSATATGPRLLYVAGATIRSFIPAFTGANWFNVAIVWSSSGGYVRGFFNGGQSGADQIPGTWVGSLGSTLTAIGSGGGASNVMNGFIAHALVLNRAATAAEIAEAYRMAF